MEQYGQIGLEIPCSAIPGLIGGFLKFGDELELPPFEEMRYIRSFLNGGMDNIVLVFEHESFETLPFRAHLTTYYPWIDPVEPEGKEDARD